ncbi:MAG: SDR family NAD(P)-dependent oxidoreductase [Bacteroidales bacterium]|nr:SDR family NAD(P)-dependent oxidoreductase [Bacteroidales bacterium]MDD4670755.1 SDR family NAD(P)-dependent oxidoreductase [Bacteroidales bacterium]
MNVLITGGSSGLGKSITLALASNKDNMVFFTYAHSEKSAKEILSMFPSNTDAIKCDFNQTEDLNSLTRSIDKMNLDLLINNAYTGRFIKYYFHKSNIEDYKTSFYINIFPVLHITRQVINLFRNKKSGQIITILTKALYDEPIIGASEYLANKAYLQSMCKSWQKENSKYNIYCDTICPPFMKTGLTADIDERMMGEVTTTEEVAQKVIDLIKMK